MNKMNNGWDAIRIKVDGFYNSAQYDPRTCNNGGGYAQGKIWVFFRNGYVLDIVDTSCGDFGYRLGAGLSARKGKPAQYEAYWTSMEDGESYSTFPEHLRGVLEYVSWLAGYRVPTEKEIQDGSDWMLLKYLETVRLTDFGAEWWDGEDQFPGWCAREA